MLAHAALLCPMPAAAGGPPVFWLGGGGAPCNFGTLSTAIGAVPDGAIINIANNQTYDDINVVIDDKSLRLIGGFADCAGTPSSEPAMLTGQAGPNLPVLRIQTGATPREVRLHNLHVRVGTRSGIEIAGPLDVRISSSIISDSQASNGGGINIIGESPALTQVSLYSTVIGRTQDGAENGNQASQAGGGVHCSNASLRFSRMQLRGNSSLNHGGGLYLNACEAELINVVVLEGGSIGPMVSAFEDNDAVFFGGGVLAIGGSVIELDALFERTVIDNNTAGRGGGIFLTGPGTRLDATKTWITNNVAETFGGGIFIENGAQFTLTRGSSYEGSQVCAPLAACSRIAGNSIPDVPTTAASAVQVSGAGLTLDQVEITANTVGNAAQSTLIFSNDSVGRISNSLIHGNDSNNGPVVYMMDADSVVNLVGSTIVGNTTGNSLIRIESDDGGSTLGLRNTIIWEPGTTIVDAGDSDIVNSVCVNAHETGSINAETHDPGFRSMEAGDYQLRLDSPNIDACISPAPGKWFDLVGIERPENLGQTDAAPEGMILLTPYDRGAYELTDLIFANGFEEPIPPI